MSTYDIVEVWKREQREEALKEGLREGLREGLKDGIHLGLQKAVTYLYASRFGTMPAELAAVVRETRDEAALLGLQHLILTGSADEVRERLLAGRTRS